MSIADWNAGIIRPVAVAPTGPFQTGAAPGMWTMDQAAYWKKQGLWPLAGNQDPANIFIENLFSTYLYTGNGTSQTITNDIDLAGKGGLVWNKDRNNANGHILVDSAVGLTKYRKTESTAADSTTTAWIFNNNGYVIPAPFGNADSQVSWTFRKQPKFFDIVTYTGDGVDPRNIPHNLGSVPGSIIIKCTSTGATGWFVYHRSLGNSKSLTINEGVPAESGTQIWGTTTPTSSVFTVGNINANTNGRTYVAYLFAHDSGGFGLSGNENVVSCGSYVGNGSTSGPEINLGYEPQWLLVKAAVGSAGEWVLMDNMRKMSVTSSGWLYANLASAEVSYGAQVSPTSTGFKILSDGTYTNSNSATYIYIAIRRGPMKVPTLGTTVFSPIYATGGSNYDVTFSSLSYVDTIISWKDIAPASSSYNSPAWNDRLRGFPSNMTGGNYIYNPCIISSSTVVEGTGTDPNGPSGSNYLSGVTMNQAVWGGGWSSYKGSFQGFKRAPGFFDEVCYTGTSDSVGKTVNHNLAVAPELMIVKSRSFAASWVVYAAPLGNTSGLILNGTNAVLTGRSDFWDSTTPTSTVFSIGSTLNANTQTWVAYLFATAPGVSKVGAYTGTGTTQAIACGFTTGARFVLIKRTDATGDWYVWDAARGIVEGNDPYLLLNLNAAEVTGTDYVDTSPAGFEISSTAPAAINANGGSYIFFAVA